jgi:membrane-bound lytic murein transglycosylase B
LYPARSGETIFDTTTSDGLAMRDWTVAGPDETLPAHASPGTWFPRWPSVAAAVAIPTVLLAAFVAPQHGSVRHHAAAAQPAAATHTVLHDFALADTFTDSATPSLTVGSTTIAAATPSSSAGASKATVGTISALAAGGIPRTALDAYVNAATRANAQDPACKLPWPLLAGIGRVESDHGRYGGAVLYSDGTSSIKILGIPLDGSRSATITDTDGGRLDGDTTYDRAVGPMQFIPSTWASYGADGNGDGKIDPFNVFDAALAAAHYLCAAGGDLSTAPGQARAVLAYNHSSAYLAEVVALEKIYAAGAGVIVPVGPAPPPPTEKPTLPPVDPGPPLGRPRHHPPHPAASSSTATPAAPSTSSGVPTTSASSASPTESAPSCDPASETATSGGSAVPSPSLSDPSPSPGVASDVSDSPQPSDSSGSSETPTVTESPTPGC